MTRKKSTFLPQATSAIGLWRFHILPQCPERHLLIEKLLIEKMDVTRKRKDKSKLRNHENKDMKSEKEGHCISEGPLIHKTSLGMKINVMNLTDGGAGAC